MCVKLETQRLNCFVDLYAKEMLTKSPFVKCGEKSVVLRVKAFMFDVVTLHITNASADAESLLYVSSICSFEIPITVVHLDSSSARCLSRVSCTLVHQSTFEQFMRMAEQSEASLWK